MSNPDLFHIAKCLGGPLEVLRTDIAKAIQEDPTNENLKNIAESFDTVHRRIIREIGHECKEVPRLEKCWD